MVQLRKNKVFCKYISAYVLFILFGFTQLPLVPLVLDIINPLNESRSKILLLRGKFLIDPDEHYYLVYFSLLLPSIVGFIIISSVDSVFLAIIHHFTGILTIVK